MSYAERLAKLKKAWAKSKPHTGGGLPEGKYQFVIKKASTMTGTQEFNKGHILVVYQVEVASGPLKGKRGKISVDIESEGKADANIPPGMDIFKGHLETLQVNIPDVLTDASLKKTLEALVGVVFEGVVVLNKKGYTNIYPNSVVHASAEEDEDEEEEEEEEDEEEEESEDDEDSDDEDEDEEEDEDEDDESDDEEDDEDEEDEEEDEKPAKKPAAKPAVKGKFQIAGKNNAPAKPTPEKAVDKKSKKAKVEEDEDWEF